jgi:hypothetical protein
MPKYNKSGQDGEKTGTNPFLPIVGFILMVGIGGMAYLSAPTLRRYAETQRLSVLGTRVLPMAFPDWPDVAIHAAIAFVIFVIVFSFAMFIAMLLIPSRRVEDETTKWLEQQQKEKKKRRGY